MNMIDERYAEMINLVERSNIKTRYDMVAYCIGYYGEVNPEIFDLINRLYNDGFITK